MDPTFDDFSANAAAPDRNRSIAPAATLYDVIGAHPDDDVESLKNAFRNAVKASHPDLHTGDPDAPSRFRQIVRANAILGDVEQRAVYDQFLAFELWQLRAASRRGIVSGALRNIASDAITVAVLAVLLAGGYVLFARVSATSDAAVTAIEQPARGSLEIAAIRPAARTDSAGSNQPSTVGDAASGGGAGAIGQGDAGRSAVAYPAARADTTGLNDLHDPRDQIELELPREAVMPSAIAPAAKNDGARAVADGEPAPGLLSNDAKFYRQRATASYRSGDLHGAIADLDRAIRLDPNFAGAYIDRGVVFYGMREFDRAFADIAQAKRIERAHRTASIPGKPHKASASSDHEP
jgi:curved DNA-binding protein CbpA